LPFLFLAACGGGGGSESPELTNESAALQGALLEVDGQTVLRDGVEVLVVETGRSIATSPDGLFDFAGVRTGTYTLDFDPARLVALEASGTGAEPEDDEDAFGRPRVEVDKHTRFVSIRTVVTNGHVSEWTKSHPNHRFARVRMELAEGASPDAPERGQIRVREWFDGVRERVVFLTCGLEMGSAVEVFVRAPFEGAQFASVGQAVADEEGCARLSFDTRTDDLPLSAEGIEALAGYDVLVRGADAQPLLTGEIPALPARLDRGRKPDRPGFGPPTRGKSHLEPAVDDVSGRVAIWDWSSKVRQRFQVNAEGVTPGDSIRFEIRDPDSGDWKSIGTRSVPADGNSVAIDTHWYGKLPLMADTVAELVGLELRVLRESLDGDTVLLEGRVPEMVQG
jgi:hypothetical protein